MPSLKRAFRSGLMAAVAVSSLTVPLSSPAQAAGTFNMGFGFMMSGIGNPGSSMEICLHTSTTDRSGGRQCTNKALTGWHRLSVPYNAGDRVYIDVNPQGFGLGDHKGQTMPPHLHYCHAKDIISDVEIYCWRSIAAHRAGEPYVRVFG